MQVKIAVSARHVHLTKEHLKELFGEGYQLTKMKDLSQFGQFAAVEQVMIQTSKDKIDRVRILGPVRPYTQVEISKADAYKLGINPPVRKSGDLECSSPITIIGPKGRIDLDYGCIIPIRHIHLTNDDVKKYNLEGISNVKVKVDGIKGGVMDNVLLKVSDNYAYEMHIDIDDANAHFIKPGDIGIVKVGDLDD